MYRKRLYINIYKCTIVFVLAYNLEQIKDLYTPEFESEELLGLCINRKDAIYVCLNVWNKDCTEGTYAHEVYHAVNFICTRKGFTHDLNNDEPIAYLTEYITKELYKFIKKYK